MYPGIYTFSSFHPGGANALMTDGSVRFLKDSTNLMTIWSLGSPALRAKLSTPVPTDPTPRKKRGQAGPPPDGPQSPEEARHTGTFGVARGTRSQDRRRGREHLFLLSAATADAFAAEVP